jgi:hypothetical protein
VTISCPKCQTDNPDTQRFCGDCGTQLPSPEKIAVTETIEAPKEELTRGSTLANRYEIIEELGKGGMGRVYKAHDTKIKETVALKLIKPEIASDKKTIERFSNEMKFARKVAHRNVCRMYEFGEEKGSHYITMEYVAGEDLKNLNKSCHNIKVVRFFACIITRILIRYYCIVSIFLDGFIIFRSYYSRIFLSAIISCRKGCAN